MQSTVVRQSYTWESDLQYFQYPSETISSYYNIDCIPHAVLLHPHAYFVTTNLYFSIPSQFSYSPPNPLPSDNHQSVLCSYESISIVFVHLFCILDSTFTRSVQENTRHCYFNENSLCNIDVACQPRRVDWNVHVWTMMLHCTGQWGR